MAGRTDPFQWVIDNCVDVQVNHRQVVAQTQARDQGIRATARGGKVWRFVVTPSPGLTYSDHAETLTNLDLADKFTVENITFDRPGMEYIGNVTQGNVSVICTDMPDWKIVSYDRIEWTGTFTFVESIV
jgi:hypothetical protein